LTGHTGALYDAAFSPDGKRIVTASADHTAQVWDAETGHPLTTLIGHTGPVNDAAFSPDGKRIITASEDATARVWDADSGILLATLNAGSGVVNDAAFSPNGDRIVTAGNDGTARVWDANIGHPLAILSGHTVESSMPRSHPMENASSPPAKTLQHKLQHEYGMPNPALCGQP